MENIYIFYLNKEYVVIVIQESCKFVDRDYFAPFDLQGKEIKMYLQDGC